ncbi:nuclear autoantigenic sperm protein [Trichoplusia ni]|uniref:Nuclear autoantigenic sperm protein n=1 Tax=Trichoplusia ni TaxID=7111 RepID=A0A7E5VL75_TRINI|nr:nuclear autoantigenic sperm protein [Trichoplusia ni]XP_026728942.1 nuclear autoantigenic sperm protein [Trichoplusia ni]
MAEVAEVSTSSASELLAAGRRHLAVGDFSVAASTLAKACEALAKEHGDTADQCAEAYLWYGKSLLGLSREESGVLGDGVPGTGNADDEEDDNEGDEIEETVENGDEPQNGGEESKAETKKENGEVETSEAESTTKEVEPSSSNAEDNEEPGTTNGDANDESVMNVDAEDDVDNLQLAWEMLDLARSILSRRAAGGAAGGAAARALLADVHLALGEVALESETYDKAVIDMQSCLDLQKELYRSDDRRIAETHYQMGLANSLASNFEDAITHFKNAANILETKIKTLETDASLKKLGSEPNSIESEIKELKELLPEIQEKIQDMMDYKAETIKRVRETLCGTNGEGSSQPNGAGSSSSASSSSTAPRPAASDISHLIKRKRKASDGEADSSAAKRVNT